MDNYLNHRWPQGPGAQPPPMPSRAAPPPAQKPRRSKRRWLVSAVCILLCLALLGGASFWAVNGLAEWFANAEFPSRSDDAPSRHSWRVSREPDWSPDELPWGEPDPSVQLSIQPASGAELSGRDIHRGTMPSIVCVQAQLARGFGMGYSVGTGIVVTQSGYVLTNYHIVEESDRVQVMLLADETTYYDAQVIGFDEEFDIAVLKFDGEDLGLSPAALGDSDALAVGDHVYALGNAMGYLYGTMTDGIVSALDRDDEVDGGGLGLIQTSAALNPGNSGGALLNDEGQVVGITSAKITGLVTDEAESIEDSAVIENIGLAIPMSDILPFVNHILATGKSWRPSIGISCTEASVDGRRGILVATVDEGVPAQRAGLAEGDLIVAANGVAVDSLAGLRRVLYRTGVDGLVVCTLIRDGEEVRVTFALIDKLEEQQ